MGLKECEKKGINFIVPLVAVILCLTAIVGIGYAITASVNNSGNTVITEDLSIDFYSDAGGNNRLTDTLIPGDEFTYGLDYTQNGIIGIDFGNTVIEKTTYLKILYSDNASSHKFDLALSMDPNINNIGNVIANYLTLSANITYSYGSEESMTMTLPGSGNTGTVRGDGETTVYTVNLKMSLDSTKLLQDYAGNLDALKTALSEFTCTDFTIKVSATLAED